MHGHRTRFCTFIVAIGEVEVKTKKKKKSKQQSVPRAERRYEYEQARREVALDRINGRIEKYNELQQRRDALIQKLFTTSENHRASLARMVQNELDRQHEALSKHEELKRMGVKCSPAKLKSVTLPEYDEDAIALSLPTAASNGKAPSKKAKKAKKAKAKKRAPADAPAESVGDEG